MTILVTFVKLIFTLFVIHFAPSAATTAVPSDSTGSENDPLNIKGASSKIPLPVRNSLLDTRFCRDLRKDNVSEVLTHRGKCTDRAVQGGSESPCQPHCYKPRTVNPGDPCDPYMYRFARRAYDDANGVDKDWMGAQEGSKGVIGRTFEITDADYKYQGDCKYLCPHALCMGVELGNEKPVPEQYVDMIKWDCMEIHNLHKYDGVCTCGHQWNFVDPVFRNHTLNASTLLVSYSSIVGLNRQLNWDKKNKRCAAARYGHCSLGHEWKRFEETENYTYCLNPESKDPKQKKFECVNRTASYLGVAYRPLKVNPTGLWYGICDSKVEIVDPFAEGTSLHAPLGWICFCAVVTSILQSIIFSYKIFQV